MAARNKKPRKPNVTSTKRRSVKKTRSKVVRSKKLDLDRFIFFANIVLVITAIVLGIVIIQKKGLLSSESLSSKSTSRQSENVSDDTQQEPQTEDPQDVDMLLSFPDQGAAQDEVDAHYNLVSDNAQTVDVIVIKDCTPDPVVASIALQKPTATFENTDSVTRTIRLPDGETVAIASGEERDVSIEFEHGQGAYGYVCDQSPKPSGVFFVTP